MEKIRECMQSPRHIATHELFVKYSQQALEEATKGELAKIGKKINELFGEGGEFQSRGIFCLACAEVYATRLRDSNPPPKEINIVPLST